MNLATFETLEDLFRGLSQLADAEVVDELELAGGIDLCEEC